MGEARTRVCCSSLSLRRTGDDLASLHKGFKIRLASIVPVSLEFTDDISIKRQLSEPANISCRSRVPGGGTYQGGVKMAYWLRIFRACALKKRGQVFTRVGLLLDLLFCVSAKE